MSIKTYSGGDKRLKPTWGKMELAENTVSILEKGGREANISRILHREGRVTPQNLEEGSNYSEE